MESESPSPGVNETKKKEEEFTIAVRPRKLPQIRSASKIKAETGFTERSVVKQCFIFPADPWREIFRTEI